LSGPWDIEEVVCQAREKSLWVRKLMGIYFLEVLNCNYMDLSLPVQPLVEAYKVNGEVEGLLSREGAHF
jgi:hypothetical protein